MKASPAVLPAAVRQERRRAVRARVVKGLDIKAVVRFSRDKVLPAKVVNLSENGTLLEISKENRFLARVEERVSVKFHLPDDIVWLPGVVKHCYGGRLGVHFSDLSGKSLPNRFFQRVLDMIEPKQTAPLA